MAYFNRNTSLINGGSGETDTPEESGAQPQLKGAHGNTRLPFGLCQRYGIALPENATPRDAWDALKGEIGLTPEKAYNDLKEKDEPPQMTKDNTLIPKDSQESGQIDYQAEKGKMLADEGRVIYSKRWTKDRLSQVLDCGTEEMSGLTTKLFNDDSFGFRDNERCAGFYPGFNKVCIPEEDDGGSENSPYSKGGTFYHEVWHAIDHNYGSQSETLSTSHVLLNGKTFWQTLTEETKTIDWSSVKASVEFERKEYSLQRFGFDTDDIINKYKEIKEKESQIWHEAGKNISGIEDAYKAQLEAREKFQNTEEYKNIVEKYNRVKGEYRHSGVIKQKWGDLSDIYDGHTKGKENLCGMYHGKTYWRKQIGARAHEAFAECGSAKATNPESWKILQKYCPKTTAAFEEIVNKLKKGEIKSNGKPKYQK